MVQPATVSAVAGCILQRLTCVGRADRRVQGMAQNLDLRNLRLTLFGAFRRLTLDVKEYRSPATGEPV
jgi:hypothetical protein